MTETRIKRHGLERFLDAVPGDSLSAAGIDIKILSELAHLNVRGNSEDDRFKQAVHDALGQELPVSPNTSSDSAHRVYWLGPDEWLILTDSQTLLDKLQNSLAGINGAVNDVSGGQIALRITGQYVRDVLAKGCTLDLHQQSFNDGMCAQSGLAKTNVMISFVDQGDELPAFDIVVRRSFSDYLTCWLQHAAQEHGVRISSS